MKERILQTKILEYSSSEELTAADQELMAEAKSAIHKSRAPYSNFWVGAAVLLENGKIVSGANIENAAYPMCLCAEQVTLATALSQFPKQKVLTLAVTVKNPEKVIDSPASPCGACRQIIVETENSQRHPIRILIQGETGPVLELESGKLLLPLGFDSDFL